MDSEYAVERTTTDKLEQALNDVAQKGRRVLETQYVGGRDWVVISERQTLLEASYGTISHAPGHGEAHAPIVVSYIPAYVATGSYAGSTAADGSVEPLANACSGYIEDQAHSWIIFLDGNGRPERYWSKRDASGGVVGNPVHL